MPGLFDGLSNLPVFEGASDEATRRALLTAGLAMMQPFNPLEGNALTQAGGGIQAGLASLDQTKATEGAIAQQDFQNIIAGRQVSADEQRADAATSQADTEARRVGAEEARIAEGARQFDAEQDLRAAKINLDEAQAEWLRRRHDGTPADSSKITESMIDNSFITARMENLYRANPAKYTLADGSKNLALLMDDSFLALHRVTGTAGNENIPIIAQDTQDAAATGANITALQGEAPAPSAAPAPTVADQSKEPTITTQAEFDALPSGTVYIHNGKRFRKP